MLLIARCCITILITAFVAACAPSGKNVAFTVIVEGNSASDYPTPQGKVISSEADWASLQRQLGADLAMQTALPSVDFTQSQLVAVFAGEKPSGGYSVAVREIVESDREIIVYVTLEAPDSSQIVITAITYPYQIVRMPRTSLPARFVF
ncbi:MAG: hypothetical protein KatS3mg053_2535 [Candidatus Roseilinea sp.]|nr:MAG: hypothetical protein KatS3mg053_2535 [Candidatus Roseilinea sp.]